MMSLYSRQAKINSIYYNDYLTLEFFQLEMYLVSFALFYDMAVDALLYIVYI